MILDYISFQEEVFLFLLCGKINNSALHVSAAINNQAANRNGRPLFEIRHI